MSYGTRLFSYALMFAIAYWTLLVCFARPVLHNRPRWWGDYSYGLYLFAFPVQQCLVALFDIRSPLALFFTALPLTLALAMLSWHAVEKPALRYKSALGSLSARVAARENSPAG